MTRTLDTGLLLRALDQMGVELAEHGHQWPESTRRLYEGAVAEIREYERWADAQAAIDEHYRVADTITEEPGDSAK